MLPLLVMSSFLSLEILMVALTAFNRRVKPFGLEVYDLDIGIRRSARRTC